MTGADFCMLLWLKQADYTGPDENCNLTQLGIELYRQIVPIIRAVSGHHKPGAAELGGGGGARGQLQGGTFPD